MAKRDNISIALREEQLRALIYKVRGVEVMLDSDLARLHGIETKVFNQAVKRNLERFPESFRFQLAKAEHDSLRSQIVTLNTAENMATDIRFEQVFAALDAKRQQPEQGVFSMDRSSTPIFSPTTSCGRLKNRLS